MLTKGKTPAPPGILHTSPDANDTPPDFLLTTVRPLTRKIPMFTSTGRTSALLVFEKHKDKA